MPFDTSFFSRPDNSPQPTGLDMISQMQGIQGQGMRNQLMQRTMAAQQARGQAYAQNTDAQGNVNAGGAMASMAQNPAAVTGLDEAAAQNQNFSQAQLTQHIQQVSQINQVFASGLKLATNADGTPNPAALEGTGGDSIIKDLGRQLAERGVPAQMIASDINALPKDGPGRYAALTQQAVAGMQAAQQAEAVYGHLYSQSDGQTTTNYRMPSVGGSAPPPMQMKTSPDFNATPMAVTDNATGAQTFQPRGNVAANPGKFGAGQPTELQHQQASAGGAAGQLGAQREVAIQGEMPQLMANRAAFRGLTADINNGMFNGNGAEAGLAVSKWAQAAGFKVDTTKIANTEDAVKAVARIVANIPGATHSDQLNAQAIAQNPTISKSPEGFARLTAMAQGYNDARLATVNGIRDFRNNNPHYPASNIPNLEGAITKLNSVPMFQYNALPDQYKHTMTDNMPGATTFINNYNKAKALGLFSKGLGE